MEHEARPQGERALVYWGSEGAVHHDDCPGLTPSFREAAYVDELERRVRWRLQVQQVASFSDLFFDGVGVRSVEQLYLHTDSGEELQEDLVRSAVGVLDGDDPITGLQEGIKGVADSRHPGGEARRILRPLQLTNLLLKGSGGGVGVATVDVPLATAEGDAHPLVEVVVAERDALHDRHLRCALSKVAFLACPNGFSGGMLRT